MKRILFALLVVFLVSVFQLKAQSDTVTVMYYNVLDFPGQTSQRWQYFKTISDDIMPDLILIGELQNNTGAVLLLDSALNNGSSGIYNKATFIDGTDTDGMLFYNKNKFALKSQDQIPTALRNIYRYQIYYKSSDIATRPDSIFINLFYAHLKASTGFESDRLAEVQLFYNYLNSHPNLENIVFGGDMNFYTASSEPAYSEITTNANFPLTDVLGAASWHANTSLAYLHTQSTRFSTGLGGGSTGGMDDRFDFIFFDQSLITGAKDAKYLANSYMAYGNDGTGNTYKTDINSFTSSVYSSNILDALFYMSDHLPVISKIVINDNNSAFCPDSLIYGQYGNAIIHQENFESLTLGAWTQYSVIGNQTWYNSTYLGNSYAYINGFSGVSLQNEDWLISPAINFTSHNPVTFSFDNACKYTGPDIQTMVSIDYTGVGDPNSATWTTLSTSLSTGNYVWTNSGDIDLSSYHGTGYVAFKYLSNTTESKIWEIDNIVFNGFVRTVTNNTCFESNDGEIDLYLGAGASPFVINWSNGASTENVSGLSAGTYHVTVTDALSCQQLKSFTVTQPAQVIASAGNDQTICNGQSATLYGSGSTNFLWSNGSTNANVTVSPTSSTSYSVTVSDANGCSDADTANVVVNQYAVSSFTYSVSNDTVYFTNTSTAYDSFIWYFGDGTTSTALNPIHVYATSNTFAVSLTVTNSCGDIVSYASIPVIFTGIDNMVSENIRIYPNPTNGTLVIENAKKFDVKIYNIIGDCVLSFKNNSDIYKVDVSKIPTGNYILQINSGNEVITKRIIIE
ncbi:MAG: hypothetical protein A2033_15195 [Bacteroidetes bacterium GWA2_31_9]|nr:MAG: hypothetical protein A2033_15195 [Bacteroidetes bacterium GWA2_31_9]